MYVLETNNKQGKRILFNTVSKQQMPIDSSEYELKNNFFLQGQEQLLLEEMLFNQTVSSLCLEIAPTLECNLRCTHCCNKHLLLDKQPNEINVDKICSFISRSGINDVKIFLYGGENFLYIDKCNEIIDKISKLPITVKFNMVTNLTLDMDERHFSFISKLEELGVSIDGIGSIHNDQRIPYKDKFNPFEKTLNNLKILIRKGLKDKIGIKICLDDEADTHKNREDLCRLIFKLGIKPKQITTGTVCPSKSQHPSNAFIDNCKNKSYARHAIEINAHWCCKYRYTVFLTDYTGNVYTDLFSYCKLGTIEDDIKTLNNKRKEFIEETMPIFNDDKCKKCPSVSACWGNCCMFDYIGGMSKYCDPQAMFEHIKHTAEDNMLCEE